MNKLSQRILRRHYMAPISDRFPVLRDYFSLPMGARMLESERALLSKSTESIFGFHLLQLSALSKDSLIESAGARHKVIASFSSNENSSASVCVDVVSLPFATDSVDGVVLHHMLDYSATPHDLLKEVKRITRPGGDIIIVGFNPYSALGIVSLWGRVSKHKFWDNRMLSVSRLIDWLTLLDISAKKIEYTFFKLPINKVFLAAFFQRVDSFLSTKRVSIGAGIYMIHAKNEYLTVTPIRPAWDTSNARFSSAVKGEYCSKSSQDKSI